ncbi:hypothetical protein EJ05DRAFT_500885 [Pseudovirgaria hyperparasitica]|uniref:Extracellular membrane protein CFEM domain-containing protein n=1 Tax=Pseudovirgaria hyperparasitica TaxID=470096 RepID=A0A6A6W5W7_9PEZI|nr:uncharacterized protein EJ05DRAFT_500885 [Pseudovirgaria hyperparasitica]KAF2757346.1 hypothetical protein EJ05DRAFT_500885 [Pseudovirgaria hyperparasitica]
MQFPTALLATLLSTALVAAQTYPASLVCGGSAQSGAVDCNNGFCCRKEARCVTGGDVTTCSDGTVAFPYDLSPSNVVSFANVIRTETPAAYSSILAQITTNAFIRAQIPSTVLDQIEGKTEAPAATNSDGAAANLRAPGGNWNGLGGLAAVWGVAAAGGAAWVFA